MNKVIVFIAILFGCEAISDDEVLNEWGKFQQKFQKRLLSTSNTKKRLEIFKQNLKDIEYHNKLQTTGFSTYRKGITQFADLNSTEFMEYVNQFRFSSINLNHTFLEMKRSRKLPSSIDWRTYNAVSRVKNQGQCGSCWSFGVTGALEGQAILRKKMQNISLSEQNLVDCVKRGNGCKGGNLGFAFDYVRRHGIDSEYHYPYEAKQRRCSQYRKVFKTKGYRLFRGESELMSAVASIGPIAVIIEVSENLQHYRSGVIYDRNCRNKLNHAVLVVGYGEESGQKYWLLKNSWGTTWGDLGYFKLARNRENNCGISSWCYYPLV